MSTDGEISSSRPKARKEYRCEWCDEKILIGEKHFQRAYIWEGDFRNGRMHLECEEAMNKTPNDILTEGWCAGDFLRGTTKNIYDN